MYSFFEKSLSLVSACPSRLGHHREKPRSHSLATPAAVASVASFREFHDQRTQENLLR